VLPRLSLTLADICKVVPKLQEQAESLMAKSPSLGDATEEGVDEMQDETDVSSATITEVWISSLLKIVMLLLYEMTKILQDHQESTEIVSEQTTSGGLPVSEHTTSGGLPRVVEAMKDFEMSLQSAQGSLMHLTEQESLEEVSEQGKFCILCLPIELISNFVLQFPMNIHQNLTAEVRLQERCHLKVTPRLHQMF
jgi:hypothetical protein